jgi:hypothetical protein
MGDITLLVKDNDGIVKTFIFCKRKYIEACKMHLNIQSGLNEFHKLQILNSWVYNQNSTNAQIDNWDIFYQIKEYYDQLEKEEFNNKVNEFIN